MRIFCFLPFLVLALAHPGRAQQYPGFSQQLYEGAFFQPARMGLDGDYVAIQYRDQWMGLEDRYAARTFLAGTDLTRTLGLGDKRIGLGLELMSDRVFIQRNFFVQGAFAYHLVQEADFTLSSGIMAGILSQRMDFSDARVYDPQDLAILEGRPGAGAFTGGLGLHLRRTSARNHVLEVDLVFPQLFNSNASFADGARYNPVPHLQLGLGYRLAGNQAIQLEPRFLLRGLLHNGNAQMAVDLGLRAFFLDGRYWAGLGVRTPGGAFHLAFGAGLGPAFDLKVLMETQSQLGFSFELGLVYTFGRRQIPPAEAKAVEKDEPAAPDLDSLGLASQEEAIRRGFFEERQRTLTALRAVYESGLRYGSRLERMNNLLLVAANPSTSAEDRLLISRELDQRVETLIPLLNQLALNTRQAGEAFLEAERWYGEGQAAGIKLQGAKRELRLMGRSLKRGTKRTEELLETFQDIRSRLEAVKSLD